MTPSQFLTLVKNFTVLTPEELNTLQTLSDQSPYSQVIHVLMARGSRDQNTPDQKDRLHRAAVCATDRSVVKWALTAPIRSRVGEDEQTPAPEPIVLEDSVSLEESGPATQSKQKTVSTPTSVTLEGDALIDDLSKELNRLQQLKHNFEDSYATLQASFPKGSGPASISQASPVLPDVGEAPLIEEIKATRKKLKVPSPKVAEQGEIIDKFIKVAPSLPKAKPTQPDTDLSEQSVNYSDNIISETLVEILLKQGKKAKAVEMLKKLIWKFPQKKAYFAAQIEALKT